MNNLSFASRPQASLILLTVCMVLGCCYFFRQNYQPETQELPAVRAENGIAGRTLMNLPAGPFVVLHYPPSVATNSENIGFREILAAESLQLSKTMRLLAFSDATTFNCVTFALADALNLTAYDWIEPFPKDATYFTDPTQIALDSYFETVVELDLNDAMWEELERNVHLQDGDVIRFSKRTGHSKVTLHMGKIYKTNHKNLMISKLGTGPIVCSPLRLGQDSFNCDHVAIYRGKSLDHSPSS